MRRTIRLSCIIHTYQVTRPIHWVGSALDPVCQLILAVDVGERTLAMVQRLGHQVTEVLALNCTPLFLEDQYIRVYSD